MGEYDSCADVYDQLMEEIPYDDWCEYVAGILKEYGVEDGLMLDMGCGTGNITERMAAKGFDMIGVDRSAEMLSAAVDKRAKSGHDILYLQQDIRELELFGTVKSVISLCDSMNYLLTQEDFAQACKAVNTYLDPGGLFVFDLKTPYYYKVRLGDQTYGGESEDCCFMWDNDYDEESRINECELTLFIKEESGLYRKRKELHYQKAYTYAEIRAALEAGGMVFVAAYSGVGRNRSGPKTERCYIVAKEHGKEV